MDRSAQGESDKKRYMVVSSDTHAGADLQGYRPYLEARYHEAFDQWAATYHDAWCDVSGNEDLDMDIGVASGDRNINWDSSTRNKELESQGIAGEVVLPNTSPPFFPTGVIMATSPRTQEDYELRWAGLRAHNRWLVDFCNDLPGRRAGVAQLFVNDIDDAIAEVEWVAESGLKGGVLMPVIYPTDGLPPLYDARYDPLYAACASLGVPISQHSGAVGNPSDNIHDGLAIMYVELRWYVNRALAHLTLGGVFERHPDLKWIMVEQGMDWIPGRLAELDFAFAEARKHRSVARSFIGASLDGLSKTPTEYYQQNCYAAASFMFRAEAAMRHDVGLDRIMWGADYPHVEGTAPYTIEALRYTFNDVPEAECRLMLGETACDLFDLDRVALEEAAARIGPSVEEIATPLEAIPADSWSFSFSGPYGESGDA